MNAARQQESLGEYCAGRRVLFINAIRADRRSGGDSCTRLLIRALGPRCTLDVVQLAPDLYGRWGALAMPLFVLASLPGALFGFLYQFRQRTWWQWLFRVSPVLAVQFLVWRRRFRPDIVLLNHHAAFFLLPLCRGLKVVTVWHDLPSLAAGGGKGPAGSDGLSRCLERRACRRSDRVGTFAYQDAQVLRRAYGAKVTLLPVVGPEAIARRRPSPSPSLLFVGNWSRPENALGLLAFMRAFMRLTAGAAGGAGVPRLHIAGAGAESMQARCRRLAAASPQLELRATASFATLGEFDDWVLVAPLLAGAGIKLKTIEAWAAGFPVIGTAQAFSGLPRAVWSHGGIRCADVDALAALAADVQAVEAALRSLSPSRAFQDYLRVVTRSR